MKPALYFILGTILIILPLYVLFKYHLFINFLLFLVYMVFTISLIVGAVLLWILSELIENSLSKYNENLNEPENIEEKKNGQVY